MKLLKRTLTLLLALTLLVSLSAAATAESPTPEPFKISWLCTNTATERYDYSLMVWLHEICKNANVELEIEIIDSGSYDNVLSTRLAAGVDLPDVVYMGYDYSMAYINAGLFYDYSDALETQSIYLKEKYALPQYTSVKEGLITQDGGIYYIPILSAPSVRCLFVNKPWLDALGMDVPTTVDEFYDYLVAVKNTDLNDNGEHDEVPFFATPGYFECVSGIWGIDLANGGYTADENGVLRFDYASENYREFLTFFNKLYTEGLLYNEYATATNDIQTTLFSKNAIGASLHHLSRYIQFSTSIDPDYGLDAEKEIMIPIEALEGPFGQGYYLGSNSRAGGFAITRDCKEPEKVFKFIDYCYSDEALELLYHGIEGEDYTYVDGEKVFSEEFVKNENRYRNIRGYNFGGFPRAQGFFNVVLTKADQIADELNKAGLPKLKYPAIPPAFTLPEEDEILQHYESDLGTYVSEMKTAFITGSKSLDEFDEYLETLKTLKCEEVTAVYQAIYDRANSK